MDSFGSFRSFRSFPQLWSCQLPTPNSASQIPKRTRNHPSTVTSKDAEKKKIDQHWLTSNPLFLTLPRKKIVFSFLRKTMHRFTFEVAIHKQSLIMKLAPAQEHVSHNPGPQIDVYPVHPLKNRSCQTESTQGWAVAQGISIWGQSDRVCRSRLAHPFPSHRYEWHAQSKDVWRCRKGKGWKGDLHDILSLKERMPLVTPEV